MSTFDKDAPFAPEGSHEAAAAEKLSGVFGDRRADGSPCCDATYVEGVKEGFGRMFYPSGKVYAVETWKGGQLEGPTTLYYETGVPQAELSYRAGLLDGTCKQFFASGKLESETPWIAGKRHGTATIHDEAGASRTLIYKDGVLVR